MTGLACPFCGKTELDMQHHTGEEIMSWVRCRSCEAMGPIRHFEDYPNMAERVDAALKLWEKRA